LFYRTLAGLFADINRLNAPICRSDNYFGPFFWRSSPAPAETQLGSKKARVGKGSL